MNNSILQKIIQKFDIGLSANSQSVSILADIKKPPWGGANQFLLALSKQLSANKIKVVNNYVGPKTKNYILHFILLLLILLLLQLNCWCNKFCW